MQEMCNKQWVIPLISSYLLTLQLFLSVIQSNFILFLVYFFSLVQQVYGTEMTLHYSCHAEQKEKMFQEEEGKIIYLITPRAESFISYHFLLVLGKSVKGLTMMVLSEVCHQ